MPSDQIEFHAQRAGNMAAARDQELRLILDEERAERRVARERARLERARQRLERAERRVDRRVRRVNEAETDLLACQERRASGPSPAVTSNDDPRSDGSSANEFDLAQAATEENP